MATPLVDDEESVDALFESVGKSLGWFENGAFQRLKTQSTQKKKGNLSKHREQAESKQKGKGDKSQRKQRGNSCQASDFQSPQQSLLSDIRVPLKELNGGGVTPDASLTTWPAERLSRSAVLSSPCAKLSFSSCDSRSSDGLSGNILLQEQKEQQLPKADLSASTATNASGRLSAASESCSSPLTAMSADTPPLGGNASMPRAQLSFSSCSRESNTPLSNGASPEQAEASASPASFAPGCLSAVSESPGCDRPSDIPSSNTSEHASSLPLDTFATVPSVQAIGSLCRCTSSDQFVGVRLQLASPDGREGFNMFHITALDKSCTEFTDTAAAQNATPISCDSMKPDCAASNSVCRQSDLCGLGHSCEPRHSDVSVIGAPGAVRLGFETPAPNVTSTVDVLSDRNPLIKPATASVTAGDVMPIATSNDAFENDGSGHRLNDCAGKTSSGSSSRSPRMAGEELLPDKESDESVDELFQNIGEKLGWFNGDKLLQLSQKASTTKKVKTKAVSKLRFQQTKKEDKSINCTERHNMSKCRSTDDKQLQLTRKAGRPKKLAPGLDDSSSHPQDPRSERSHHSAHEMTARHRQSSRGANMSADDDDEEDDKFEAFLAAARTPSGQRRIVTTDEGPRRSIDDFVVDNDEVEYDSSASPSSIPSPDLKFYSAVNRFIDASERRSGRSEQPGRRRKSDTSSSGGSSSSSESDTCDDDCRDELVVSPRGASSFSDDDRVNAATPARRPPVTPAAMRLAASAVRATPTQQAVSEPKRHCSFLKSLDANLPEGVARDPSCLKYLTKFRRNRDELAANLHKLYNETVFDGKLTDVPVIWNNKMLKTAGFCYYTTAADQHRSARIELATKVVDRPDRLRDTLLHEMCHAATWVVYGQRQGHGALWQMWGRLACSVHPDLQVVTRCHHYEIAKKYTYRCSKCSQTYGRHSKSIDVERHRCGICKGTLELIVQDGRCVSAADAATSSGSAQRAPKTPGRFALFVKENYGKLKTGGDGVSKRTHGEVMRELAEAFARLPPCTGLTDGADQHSDDQ